MRPAQPLVNGTSESHPITVSYVQSPTVPGQGLGLTICPGKYQAVTFSGKMSWERNLDTDLRRLREEYHGNVLVPLIEYPDEYQRLRVPNLVERATEFGFRVVPYSISDGGVPQNVTTFVAFIRQVLALWRAGHSIIIHCMGGLGRTGLVAACCIIASGVPTEEAMAMVKRARPHTLKDPGQAEFVKNFQAAWQATQKGMLAN